jgi:hypothetical protein
MQRIKRFRLAYDIFDKQLICCECDVLRRKNGENIVVFTELRNNPGKSVTNAAAEIIAAFCKVMPDYTLDNTIFIERYEERPQEFDRIFCSNGNVQWRRIIGSLAKELCDASC